MSELAGSSKGNHPHHAGAAPEEKQWARAASASCSDNSAQAASIVLPIVT